MVKSATDVMEEIIFSAVIDAFGALKTASKGLPNSLLRDLNAVHANTTFSDLPKELQLAINGNVRAAFVRLLKEGYSVSNAQSAPPRNFEAKGEKGSQHHPGKPHEKTDRTNMRRGPRPGGRPSGKPKPGRG